MARKDDQPEPRPQPERADARDSAGVVNQVGGSTPTPPVAGTPAPREGGHDEAAQRTGLPGG